MIILTENLIVDAGKLVKGVVDPQDLTATYVLLRHPRPIRLVQAANLLVKYGWRAVGFGQGSVMMERM